MSDTAQIAGLAFMILSVIAGWINAKAQDTAATVYCMSVALIIGMVIF